MVVLGLAFERGKYKLIINPEFFKTMKDKSPADGREMMVTLYQFYDKYGNVVETMQNITYQWNFCLQDDYEKSFELEGIWEFDNSVYMDMPLFGRVLIDAIQYKIPTYTDEFTFLSIRKASSFY